MIVRIKFSNSYGSSNRLNKKDLESLRDFLGEEVQASQLKIDVNGEISRVSYSETLDQKVAEENNYTLVDPADMYEIDSTDTYLVDFETFAERYPSLEFSIRGVPKSVGSSNLDLMEGVKLISEKMEQINSKFDKSIQFNQRCDIHVPGLGLMSINKVAYATDYCTVELQRLLKQGWRIISVCPQPDQRRPDYILGMHVPELGEDVDVEHYMGNGKENE